MDSLLRDCVPTLRCAPARPVQGTGGMTPSAVITGLVPVIPIRMVRRYSKRDSRDKPGHDGVGLTLSVIPGERSEGRESRAE